MEPLSSLIATRRNQRGPKNAGAKTDPTVYRAINSVQFDDATNIGGALLTAYPLFGRRPNRKVLLVTDGQQNVKQAPDPVTAARYGRKQGITTDIIAIGRPGLEYNPSVMLNIAEQDGGRYWPAETLEGVVEAWKARYRRGGYSHP